MLGARTLSQTIAERAQGAGGQAELHNWINSTYEAPDYAAPVDADSLALALEALDPVPQQPPVARKGRGRRSPLRPILMLVGLAAMSAVIVQWRIASLHFASGREGEPASVSGSVAAATVPATAVSSTAIPPPVTPEGDASRPTGVLAAEPATPRGAREAIELSEPKADVATEESGFVRKAQPLPQPLAANPVTVPVAPSVAVAALTAPPALPKKSVLEKSSSDKSGDAAEAPKPATTGSPERAGTTELESGRAYFAKGNLTAARQSFERAARSGLPEGALALGNTYDPVSLTKLGLTSKGDAVLARQWYRRAHEIALQKPIAPALHAASTTN